MAEDYEKGMIDLGREVNPMSEDDNKPYTSYPTLYASGLETNPNLPEGEFYFVCKGKVVGSGMREVKDNDGDEKDGQPDVDYNIELEIHGIKPIGQSAAKKASKSKSSEDSLNEAFDGIAAKKNAAKAKPQDDEEGEEEMDDEEESEE